MAGQNGNKNFMEILLEALSNLFSVTGKEGVDGPFKMVMCWLVVFIMVIFVLTMAGNAWDIFAGWMGNIWGGVSSLPFLGKGGG